MLSELSDPKAPDTVRKWATSPPAWLTILDPSSRLPSTVRLDPGEAAAISLAKEIHAPAVLLDENRGRKVARAEGLIVVRTLALLEMAAERQLLELRPALEKLSRTSFRMNRELIIEAIARDKARKSSPPNPHPPA